GCTRVALGGLRGGDTATDERQCKQHCQTTRIRCSERHLLTSQMLGEIYVRGFPVPDRNRPHVLLVDPYENKVYCIQSPNTSLPNFFFRGISWDSSTQPTSCGRARQQNRPPGSGPDDGESLGQENA